MKNIGIYSNADKDKDFAGTAAVIGALGAIRLTCDGVGVFMDISQECAVRDTIGEDAIRDVVFLPECEMTRTIDVMIVLGGDGTLLKGGETLFAGGDTPARDKPRAGRVYGGSSRQTKSSDMLGRTSFTAIIMSRVG